MRSALLILLTVVVLAGAFVAYTMIQPSHARHGNQARNSAATRALSPDAMPATAPANDSMPVTGGDNVFVESYDKATGLLASRFRASRYDPQPDGTVHVEHPEAEFYMNSKQRDASGQPVRQVLRLRGVKGDIVVPPTAGGTQSMSRAQMPTRGKLQDVTVSLFPTVTAKRPTLTCRVNNLVFDNDTFRIATDPYTQSDGTHVEADRVPVFVTGDDYDFDGEGLTILWNEKDGDLQLLEVAHGRTLVVKKPGALGTPTPTPTTTSAPKPAPKPAPKQEQHANAAAHGARSRRAAQTKPATEVTPSTKPARQPTPYRATFFDNVVITQGGQQIGVADVMTVDFLNDNDEDAAKPAAEPPREEPSASVKRKPATAPSGPRRPNDTPPSAAPANPNAPVPVVVHWTGKLRVSPVPPDETPPTRGDSVVELSSQAKPVLLNWQGSDVICASARYHALDDSATIRSSDAVPMIRMKDQRGLSITTPSFDYDGQTHVAVMRGASVADIPLDQGNGSPTTAPATQPAGVAHVEWVERCTMRLAAGATRQEMSIEHAQLEGNVQVDSPQLAMRSDKMDLTFDPDAKRTKRQAPDDAGATGAGGRIDPSSAPIRRLDAQGTVKALIRSDTPDDSQRLDCNKLLVHFEDAPDGRAVPRQIVADDSVVASRAGSDLRAGHLEATLAPSTQPSDSADVARRAGPASMPSMQVESMVAVDDVRASGSDGAFARADRLTLEQTADGPKYKLVGERDLARAGDARNVMTGPTIEFEPNTGRAHVIGPGTLHGVQSANANNLATRPTTRPIDLAWTTELKLDSVTKHGEITGDVVATSTQNDGTKTIARGDKMILELMDPPPPSTKPSDSNKKRSSPLAGFAGNSTGAPAIGDIRTVTLERPQNVEVNSTLLAPDGSILKRTNLFAPTLTYDLPGKRMTIPVAGRMLYQDERSPTTNPTTMPTTTPVAQQKPQSSAPLGDTRGATAFEWHNNFTYDSASHLATMTGDVAVVHQPSGSTTPSYRLNAQRVVAEMQDPPATQPDQPKSSDTDPLAGGAKLKHLTADGGVTFVSDRLQFNAESIDYDPDKQLLIARGTDREPATLFDQSGLSKGTFAEMYYDTKTDRMKLVKPQATLRK